MTQQMICSNCGYVGVPKRVTKGSMGIEIVLWLFFIIPGVIYSLWRGSSKFKACPSCGAQNMIPLDTPNGRKLLQDQDKTVEQAQAEVKARPMDMSKKVLIGVGVAFGFFVIIGFISSMYQ